MELTPEEASELVEVSRSTSMGELLRRYWHPIMPAAWLEQDPVQPIRLLGQDLVLFQDLSGRQGIIDRFCAHRGADLALGSVEGQSIRCPYHGWLYDRGGQCLEQPLEWEPPPHDVKLDSYLLRERAGILWAYLGPTPAPLIPDWEPFHWEDGLVQIVTARLDCNWLQCHENSIEPDSGSLSGGSEDWRGYVLSSRESEVQETSYGFQVAADERASPGSDLNKVSIWPNGLFAGDRNSCHFEWYVPIDRTGTLLILWFFDRATGSVLSDATRIQHWPAAVRDESNELITSHPINRRLATWLCQGPVLDRTNEHLSSRDQALMLLRERYRRQADLVRDGGEPKFVLRDPADNRRLALPPTSSVRAIVKNDPSAFPHVAGQPQEIAAIWRSLVLLEDGQS